MVADGRLDPLVSQVLPLEGLLGGLQALHERKTTGRVLLRPDL